MHGKHNTVFQYPIGPSCSMVIALRSATGSAQCCPLGEENYCTSTHFGGFRMLWGYENPFIMSNGQSLPGNHFYCAHAWCTQHNVSIPHLTVLFNGHCAQKCNWLCSVLYVGCGTGAAGWQPRTNCSGFYHIFEL